MLNVQSHNRQTRCANFNIVCPAYNHQTEGGRTLSVLTTKSWNSLPLNERKLSTEKSFTSNIQTPVCTTTFFESLSAIVLSYVLVFNF